jgi:hypothetical protein
MVVVYLLVVFTTFLGNPTLTESLYSIPQSGHIKRSRLFVDAANGARPHITNADIRDLSSLAAECGPA